MGRLDPPEMPSVDEPGTDEPVDQRSHMRQANLWHDRPPPAQRQYFEGPVRKSDVPELLDQYKKIFTLMSDGKWRTLIEIEETTGYPQASISAQLRHMRKERFGEHTVDKRRRDGHSRLWEYQLLPAEEGKP